MKHISKLPLVVALGCALGMAAATPTVGKRAAALDDSAWNTSQWISVVDAPVVAGPIQDETKAAPGASWFMTTVKNGKKVKKAVWMTAGLGVYTLYINGRPVGEEVLKPGFTHHGKTKRSFTYDVTDALRTGSGEENVFSAHLTPGWWGDNIVTPPNHEGFIGKKTAFRGVLELTYDDGTTELCGTDTDSWIAGIAGPVQLASIFDGEEYDARHLPGYLTPEKLSKPEINSEFAGEILPSEGGEVYFRDDLALAPVEAYAWKGVTGEKEGEYGTVIKTRVFAPGEEVLVRPGETVVVDFGQNAAAVPEFVFSAAEGTRLSCYPSEILNDGNGARSRGMDGPEGSTHRENLRQHDVAFRLHYTFADNGDKPVSYRPERTFFGYRYVALTADGGDVRIKEIRSIPVSSLNPRNEIGKLTTGNADINKLISNSLWGMRSNYLSIPTDCPQRNERLGWTADTQVFSETGTFFADTAPFFHKWLRDLRDSQGEQGGFPGVAPLAQYGNELTRLGWSDAGVIVPWTIWKQFGDTAIVAESWQSMEKYMDYIAANKYDHEALRHDNGDYQWADWLSYEPLESCSGRKDYTDENGKRHVRPETYDYWNFLSSCYWLMNAEMMRDMAVATGRDAAKYDTMAKEARRYASEKFFTPDGAFRTEILNTMQTPALFALKNGLVSGSAKTAMVERLRKNFAEHGNCLQTGFLGTSILMPTLTENGMNDIAYELLFQRNNPSWLYSIDNNATTIWERWNSYMLDKGMGPQGMNSFNHYAYGCVCEWLWETVAGIAADTSAPGFRRIIMKPQPDRRLGNVDAVYHSAAGTIESRWCYEGDKWIWTFRVPDGAEASVTLPGSDTARTYTPGVYTVEI